MKGVAMAAKDYLTKEEIKEVGTVSRWRGVASILGTWGWIVAAWALFAWRPSILTFAVAWVVVSGRHLGLAILMHEAAHYLVHPNKRFNDRFSSWTVAYPAMLNVEVYRAIHFQHHRATWTEADPDLSLAKPFPVSKWSFVRKVLRDLSGRTGYHRYREIMRLSAGIAPKGQGLMGTPVLTVIKTFWQNQRGFLITNTVLLGALAAAGHWEIFFLLWWLPAVTGYSLVLRIRSIAEHAVVPDPKDELKQTRTTLAPFWLRFLMAPHHVNYHLEHHLFMFVPHYRLPRVHRLLKERGVLDDAEVAPSYLTVLRQATSG